MTTTFNEADHPRAVTGRFAPRASADSEASLGEPDVRVVGPGDRVSLEAGTVLVRGGIVSAHGAGERPRVVLDGGVAGTGGADVVAYDGAVTAGDGTSVKVVGPAWVVASAGSTIIDMSRGAATVTGPGHVVYADPDAVPDPEDLAAGTAEPPEPVGSTAFDREHWAALVEAEGEARASGLAVPEAAAARRAYEARMPAWLQ